MTTPTPTDALGNPPGGTALSAECADELLDLARLAEVAAGHVRAHGAALSLNELGAVFRVCTLARQQLGRVIKPGA